MLFFGSFLYIAVLLINSVAILSEDRFLARSTPLTPLPLLIACPPHHHTAQQQNQQQR